MSLKVTILTFATPLLEKIPRLTASPLSYRISPLLRIPLTLQQFFHPIFLGIFAAGVFELWVYIQHCIVNHILLHNTVIHVILTYHKPLYTLYGEFLLHL